MKKKKLNIGLLLSSIGVMIILFASCKRYVDPPPYFEEPGDTTRPAARKVLFIGIDGAVAAEYKKMSLPILQSMLTKGKFTWDGVADELSTDAASWKTLMTGASYSRHKIKDSSFIYTQGIGDPQHSAVPNFPSIFSYILSSPRNDMRTVFISPWPTLIERLVPEVQDPVIAVNDLGVKDSALKRIKTGNPDFMVLNFNSVAIAGKAGAFLADNLGYKAAALAVDAYIGELLTALKTRPGYDKTEEWLVIVNSTHGGTGNSYGGFSNAETEAFSVYYNERFKPTEFTKQGSFVNVQLKGGAGTAGIRAVMSDPTAYNPGTSPMTLEMKVKGTRNGSFPLFLTKKGPIAAGDKLSSADPGFVLFTGGSNNLNMEIRGTTGVRSRPGAGNAIFDDKWHTISLVFIDSAGKYWEKRYVDGVWTGQTDLSTYGSITSSAPLILGFGQGNAGDGLTSHVAYNVADVKIFNIGMNNAEVAASLCLQDITQHPKYANLTGYWPCNDGFGGRFKNLAPGAVNKDFILENSFSWVGLPLLPCTTPGAVPAGKTNLFTTNSGVATTIFYWLKMNVLPAWGIEGSKWLEPYEPEFVKL